MSESELSASDRVTLNRAKTAVLSRDYSLAEQLYKNLLLNNSNNVEFLTGLADLYVKNGQDSEAMPVYQQILEIDSKNLNAINNLGCIYRRFKQYRDSMSVLEQGIIIDEKNVQLFYNLGLTYKDLGKNQRAIQCFEMVIDLNPNDVLAYNNLGSIYLMDNLYEKAIPVFQRGLKQDPNHPALHLNLARAFHKQGDIAKATQEYEAALRARPGWLDAIDGFADLLLEKSNTSKAKTLVENAIKLNPENSEMHTKMGVVYNQQSAFDNAELEFNEALDLDPDNKDALSGLADAYEADGKIVEAMHTMERYEKLDPESIKMLRQYTHILLSGNKLSFAHEKIKQIWAKQPDDVQTLNLLGQYYICNGEEDKAEGCFDRINEINPDYTLHYRESALRYKQKGDSAKAEQNLLKYLDTNEDDSKALNMLVSHYEENSRFEDALGLYEKLAEKDETNERYKKGVERINNIITGKALASDDGGADAVFSKKRSNVNINPFENPIDADLIDEEPEEEEIDELSPEYSSPMDFESLTKEDDSVSPFENIEDEIMANHSKEDDFDSLLPETTGHFRDDDDFFRNNSFGDSRRPMHEESPMPAFESENLNDGYDRSTPIELDEDVQELEEERPPKPENKPKPKKNDIPKEVEEEEDSFEEFEPDPAFEESPEELEQEEEEPEILEELEPDSEEDEPEILDELEPEPEQEEVEFLDEDNASEEADEDDEIEYLPEAIEEEEEEDFSVLDEMDSENFDSLEEEIPSESDELMALPSVEDQLEDLDSEEEDLQELESAHSDMASMADTVNQIKNAINDNTASEKYKKVADMFIHIKSLISFLPDEDRFTFLQSKEHIMLEYIIAKLQGKPGLLAVSDACRREFEEDISFLDSEDSSCQGRQLAKSVFNNMDSLIKNLDDYEIADSLREQISGIMNRL